MSDDARDSPLSTISNVAGLLTFAIGLLTLFVTFLSITHSAEREIADIGETLNAREGHIHQINNHFHQLWREANSALEGSKIMKEFLTTMANIEANCREAKAALEKNSKRHRWWWYYRHDVMSSMAAIETHFQHLNTIQLTFLLITMRGQQDHIDEVEVSLNKVQQALRIRSNS